MGEVVKGAVCICIYKQTVVQLWKMIVAIDSQREGLKVKKSYGFTYDWKFFLLVAVFGFNAAEVSKMLGKDHKMVSHKVKRMSDKYKGLFAGGQGKAILKFFSGNADGNQKERDLQCFVSPYFIW